MSVVNKIEVIRGDITILAIDAIVNAANSSLMGGGGVDGAIHASGGPVIKEQCRQIVALQGPCQTGDAVITTGGNLPCKYVIHTVGPVWSPKTDQSELLANCYRNSLLLAVQHHCQTVAFPNISTGVYGYPKPKAAKIAVDSIHSTLITERSLKRVILCCFDEENYLITSSEIENL